MGVNFHQFGESFGTGLDVSGEHVDLACAVIYEANHVDVYGGGTIGRHECCAVAFFFVAVKESAADQCPYDGRVCAALAGAVDWEYLAVGVEFLGYPE